MYINHPIDPWLDNSAPKLVDRISGSLIQPDITERTDHLVSLVTDNSIPLGSEAIKEQSQATLEIKTIPSPSSEKITRTMDLAFPGQFGDTSEVIPSSPHLYTVSGDSLIPPLANCQVGPFGIFSPVPSPLPMINCHLLPCMNTSNGATPFENCFLSSLPSPPSTIMCPIPSIPAIFRPLPSTISFYPISPLPITGGFPGSAMLTSTHPNLNSPMSAVVSQLQNISNQLCYYFSKENLVKDRYLKEHMDEGGFVPISLLSMFPKLVKMTSGLTAMERHDIVTRSLNLTPDFFEVHNNEKVRLRHNWRQWIYPR